MPKTLEQAVDEINERQHEEGHTGDEEARFSPEAGESPEEQSAEEAYDNIDTILTHTPEEIGKDRGRRISGTVGRVPDLKNKINQTQVNVGNFDDIDEILLTILNTEIAQLSALFDILDEVEPLTTIAVNGVNTLDNANVREPVVPLADKTDIFVRELYIKSSHQNTEDIWLGDNQVKVESGLSLSDGESVVVDMDQRANPLYMVSEVADQEVEIMGMR